MLIYKGDTIKNFGEYLPSPYIERVYIDTTSITIGLSLVLNTDPDVDIEEYIDYLREKDLKIYLLFSPYEFQAVSLYTSTYGSFTYEEASATTPTEKNIANAADIIEGNRHVFEGFYKWYTTESFSPPAGTWDAGDRLLYQEYSINEFGILPDVGVDALGNSIVKLYAQLSFPDTTANTFNPVYYWGDRSAGSGNGELYMFAFTSVLSADDVVSTIPEHTSYFDAVGNNLLMSLPNVAAQTSNVAYEKIFINGGEAAFPSQINYFDLDGNLYNKLPLKNVDSIYYKSDKITYKNIVKRFRELVKDYRGSKNQNVQDAITNILYIINNFGRDVDLIMKLNQYKLIYPYKGAPGPAGEIGRLYRKLVNKIIKLISTTDRLKKVINKNAKVIDRRGVVGLPYVPPTLPEWAVEGYVEEDSQFVHSYRNLGREIYSAADLTMEGEEETAHGVTIGKHIRNFGYFYFDYEKALGAISTIARVFPVKKIQTLFGPEILQKEFQVTDARLHRTIRWGTLGGEDTGAGVTATVNKMDAKITYSQGYPAVEYIDEAAQPIDFTGWTTPGLMADSGYITETVYGSDSSYGVKENYSYIKPRNFNFTDSDMLDDYRLLAFEYQDFYNKSAAVIDDGIAGIYLIPDYEMGASEEYYITTVELTDNTATVAQAVMDSYLVYKEHIERYFELAEQKCSANNIDGTFNEFFGEGIKEMFPAESGTAPWIVGPAVYHLHLDLITNRYNGSIETIKEYARLDAAKIDPTHGNLENLQAFRDKYDDLYTEYYSDKASLNPETPIGALYNITGDPTLHIGSVEEGSTAFSMMVAAAAAMGREVTYTKVYNSVEREFSTKHNINNITPLNIVPETHLVTEEMVRPLDGARYDQIYKILPFVEGFIGSVGEAVTIERFLELDSLSISSNYVQTRMEDPIGAGYWSVGPTIDSPLGEVSEANVQRWMVRQVSAAFSQIHASMGGDTWDTSDQLWFTMMRNWLLDFSTYETPDDYIDAVKFSILGRQGPGGSTSRWFYAQNAILLVCPEIIGCTDAITDYPPGDIYSYAGMPVADDDGYDATGWCDHDSAVVEGWETVAFLWNGMLRWFRAHGGYAAAIGSDDGSYATTGDMAHQAVAFIAGICAYNIMDPDGPQWNANDFRRALIADAESRGYGFLLDDDGVDATMPPRESPSGRRLEMLPGTTSATWNMGGCEDGDKFEWYCKFKRGTSPSQSMKRK